MMVNLNPILFPAQKVLKACMELGVDQQKCVRLGFSDENNKNVHHFHSRVKRHHFYADLQEYYQRREFQEMEG
jgi:hypothetical protein